MSNNRSDGSTASYYELPEGAKELQDLISDKDMNAQIGEIFRACYRYGQVAHSYKLRDAKKIKFYAEAEITRLERESNRLTPDKGVSFPDQEKYPGPKEDPLSLWASDKWDEERIAQVKEADLVCPLEIYGCGALSSRERTIIEACNKPGRTKYGLLTYLHSKGCTTVSLDTDLCRLLHCNNLQIQGKHFISTRTFF